MEKYYLFYGRIASGKKASILWKNSELKNIMYFMEKCNLFCGRISSILWKNSEWNNIIDFMEK